MKTFYAQLNDGSTICRKADRMELVDDTIRVYENGELIAFLDTNAVVYAQIHIKGEKI